MAWTTVRPQFSPVDAVGHGRAVNLMQLFPLQGGYDHSHLNEVLL